MPYTQESVEQWKAAHGKIFAVTISGEEFVYRGFTLGELKTLRDNEIAYVTSLQTQQLAPEEVTRRVLEASTLALCKLCVLYPVDYAFDKGLAGVPETLQPLIMNASGFPEEIPQPTEL